MQVIYITCVIRSNILVVEHLHSEGNHLCAFIFLSFRLRDCRVLIKVVLTDAMSVTLVRVHGVQVVILHAGEAAEAVDHHRLVAVCKQEVIDIVNT